MHHTTTEHWCFPASISRDVSKKHNGKIFPSKKFSRSPDLRQDCITNLL